MRLIEGEYWFNYQELSNAGVARKTVEKAILRGSKSWQLMSDPDDHRLTLVSYSSMPEKYRLQVQATLLSGLEPDEVQAMNAEEPETEDYGITKAVTDGYKDFLRHYREYEHDQRKMRTLARCAAIVKALATYSNTHGWTSYKPYNRACELMEGWLAAKRADGKRRATGEVYLYEKYLSTAPVRLKEQIKLLYRAEIAPDNAQIAASIQPPRSGDKATFKGITALDNEIQAHFFRLLASGRGVPEQGYIRTIQRWCQVSDRKVPSDSWFRQQFSDHYAKALTAANRWDKGNKYRQRYDSHIPMSKPVHSGEIWSIDGTRFNFVPFLNNPDRFADGLSYLYLVAVHDAMSGKFVGYHFDTTEDGSAVLSALRMAVEVSGYLPAEMRFDRFPGHDSLRFRDFVKKVESFGVRVTITSQAQGKPIERAFGTLQSVFMSQKKYYYGEGIRSTRSYAHATATVLKRATDIIKKQAIGFSQLWIEAVEVMEAYNETSISEYSKYQINLSPSELHAQSLAEAENPCPIRVDAFQTMEIFEQGALYNHTGDQLKIIHRKTEYIYTLEYDVFMNYKQVYVKYDEADMSQVYLYHPENHSQALGIGTKFDRFSLTGPNADPAALGRRKAKIASDEARRKVELQALIAPVADAPEVEILMKGRVPKGVSEQAEDRFYQSPEMSYALRNEKEVTQAPKEKVKRKTKKAEEEAVIAQSNHWLYGNN